MTHQKEPCHHADCDGSDDGSSDSDDGFSDSDDGFSDSDDGFSGCADFSGYDGSAS